MLRGKARVRPRHREIATYKMQERENVESTEFKSDRVSPLTGLVTLVSRKMQRGVREFEHWA